MYRLVWFEVFRCYHAGKRLLMRVGVRRLAPALDDTRRLSLNRPVNAHAPPLLQQHAAAELSSARETQRSMKNKRPRPRAMWRANGQGRWMSVERRLEARVLHWVVVVCDLARHLVNSVARDAKGGENLVLDLVSQLRVVCEILAHVLLSLA